MADSAIVVGGGIAGLAAALELADAGIRVTVLEGSETIGGTVQSVDFGGITIDRGADSFLTRIPDTMAFMQRIGVMDQLVAPVSGDAYVLRKGKPRKFPTGTALGVPKNLKTIRTTELLSLKEKARAARDFYRVHKPQTDGTVGGIVTAHLGSAVASYMCEPLLGGVYAGDINVLLAEFVNSELARMHSAGASLLRKPLMSSRFFPPSDALSSRRKSGPILKLWRKEQRMDPDFRREDNQGQNTTLPVFLGHPAGMGAIIKATAEALRNAGGNIITNKPISEITRDGKKWQVIADGTTFTADVVIIAIPPRMAADVIPEDWTATQRVLRKWPVSSVALAVLRYPRSAIKKLPEGSGFLVPRAEHNFITACSWASQKWKHLSLANDVLMRVSTGNIHDAQWESLSDSEIVERMHGDLAKILKIDGSPTQSLVSRYPGAFPQYALGHKDRLRIVNETQTANPGIAFTGNAYGGVGLAATIAHARQTARDVQTSV